MKCGCGGYGAEECCCMMSLMMAEEERLYRYHFVHCHRYSVLKNFRRSAAANKYLYTVGNRSSGYQLRAIVVGSVCVI